MLSVDSLDKTSLLSELFCYCPRFHDIVVVCAFTLLLSSPAVPLSASELSLTEARDKVPPLRRLDPGLMPLPDTACGLEWSSLVNAAKAYEGETPTDCTMTEML